MPVAVFDGLILVLCVSGRARMGARVSEDPTRACAAANSKHTAEDETRFKHQIKRS
ncbi:hypothetical protein GCM10020219_042200 [Nonomuraea dietziae]